MCHRYTGDLEITLSDSLTITIPNSQLVIPERDYGDDGRPRITNDKTRGLLINGLDGANTNDIPLLGRAFLTSAYLHVNNEKNEWSMWQAYAVADQKLVSVPGPGDLACPSNTTGSTTTGNNGTSSPAPVNGSTALTTGSIVGLALGSVTFLLLLALAAFLLLRRRRNRINHPKRTTLSDMYPAKLVFETPLSGSRWKSKRRTMTGSVRELSAGGGSVRELSSDGAVVELPQMSSRKVRVNGAPAVYHEVPGAEMPAAELPGHDR